MSLAVSVQSVRRRRIGSLFLCHNLQRFSAARPKQKKKIVKIMQFNTVTHTLAIVIENRYHYSLFRFLMLNRDIILSDYHLINYILYI